MNWLFQSVFCTHKILRGDLEELPIWTDYFIQNDEFSEETLLYYLKIEKKDGTYSIKK
jgi:site-specific DNA-methyltransferase (adenine-specific)